MFTDICDLLAAIDPDSEAAAEILRQRRKYKKEKRKEQKREAARERYFEEVC